MTNRYISRRQFVQKRGHKRAKGVNAEMNITAIHCEGREAEYVMCKCGIQACQGVRMIKHGLNFEAVKELADAIEKPPYLWNESQLWNAYAALEKSRVKGASGKRILTDLISLVRFAIHQDRAGVGWG